MRRLFFCGLLLAITPCLSTPVQATVDDTLEQIEDAMDDPLLNDKNSRAGRKFPPLRLSAREEVEWGDFDGTDVTMFRTSVSGEVRFPVTEKLLTSISSRYGITATDFGGDKDFVDVGRPSGDPWDELHDFSLRIRSQYSFNDSWGVLFSTWMTSRWEDGSSFDDGVKGAGAVALSYRIGKKFSVAGGVSVSSRIVGSGASVNPFGQLSWMINDRHTLQTSGMGLRLRSKWNSEITTFTYASLRGRRWRLDDRKDGRVDKGSLRDRKVPIGVGVQWKFAKGWRLQTDLGVVAYRQLKTSNEDNDEIDSDKMKAPGVFGSLMLQARF